MKKESIKVVVIITILAVVVGISAYYLYIRPDNQIGGTLNNYFGSTSSSSVNTDTTSTVILVADSGRGYVKCANYGPKGAYVAYDPISVATIGSFYVAVSGSFEILLDNMYSGTVSAITTAGSATFSCFEQ